MTDRQNAIEFMHKSAEQLRWIASLQTFLAPQLLRTARGLDELADELETASKAGALEATGPR